MNRRAFSLVELLVVITVLAIMAGLTLPAVQKVRATTQRMKCQSNLRQLALALHVHSNDRGNLPPGHRSNRSPDGLSYTGWTLDILPYIEHSDIYDEAIETFRTQPSPFRHRHRYTTIKNYQCPSDPRVTTPQISQRTESYVALTSYLGVSGLHSHRANGVLYPNSKTKLDSITDGTSNTLLLGERPPSHDFQFGWWYAGIGQGRSGSNDMILAVRERNVLSANISSCPRGEYPFENARYSDPCAMFHFWSPHSRGANFAFADGSVKFLPYSMNELMPALASRSGGEPVSLD